MTVQMQRLIACALAVALTGIAAAATRTAEPPTMDEALEYVQAEEWEEAIDALNQIVEAEPDNAQAWFMLAFSTHASGDLDKALLLHRKAAEFEEFRATALYNIGCVHALQGRSDAALEALSKAIDEGFTQFAHARTDPDLESLQNDPRFRKLFRMEPIGVPEREGSIDLAKVLPEKRFDFMVGSWTITSEQGMSGTETTRKILGGQAIEQEGVIVIDPQGGELKYRGLLSFDQSRDGWRQTWVSSFGDHDHFVGQLEEGSMVMIAKELSTMPDAMGRLTFSKITTSSFDMDWAISQDGGETWQTQLSAHYRRVDSAR